MNTSYLMLRAITMENERPRTAPRQAAAPRERVAGGLRRALRRARTDTRSTAIQVAAMGAL
jgi:hypothetical protein